MEEKKEKRLKIIIVLLTVLVIGLSGFIVIDKFIRKDNMEEKENSSSVNKTPSESPKPTPGEEIKEPEEEEIEIPVEQAEKIFNMFYDAEDCGTRFSKYYKYDKVTADELTNEDKTYIISLNIAKRMDEHIFTEEEILKTKNQLLGEDTKFEIINSKECKNFFKLDNGTYDLNRYCSGGMCTYQEIKNIVKAVQKGDKVYLDQKVVFERTENHQNDEGLTSYYYQNPAQTILLEKREYKDNDEYLEKYYKFGWEKYENQISIYRYTYQNNGDDTYRFIQMEKIK